MGVIEMKKKKGLLVHFVKSKQYSGEHRLNVN